MLAAGVSFKAPEKLLLLIPSISMYSCIQIAATVLGRQAILKCLYSNMLKVLLALKIRRKILNLSTYSV